MSAYLPAPPISFFETTSCQIGTRSPQLDSARHTKRNAIYSFKFSKVRTDTQERYRPDKIKQNCNLQVNLPCMICGW